MSNEKVVHLTDTTFDEEIKSGFTLVDFWAEWCGPCLALAPAIDELANTYDGQLKVCKVDVDSNQTIPARFGIRGIPTVILFKDGEQADMFTGNSPQKIKEMVDRALVN
ncbi:MAG: thioredoxin [SAR324 cluster bacterium]|nr:thioredoxin [SAR324 cluster bacterium]